MGGAVSAGRDNEELVDNLCYEGYIHEPHVEKVFRQIDRSEYMTFEEEDNPLEAYEDHAWRKGTLHLSAPCIYSRAVEALKFEKGVSFLNVGSGTGYLSTMAGLLIGPYGINHGIELHPDNVEYAHKKLAEFHEKSQWYDPVEFCEPLFVVGNGLLVSPGNVLYDRIYCGAACPPEHAQLMKNMISVGGLLVMPLESELECIHRTGETDWETNVILPSVSFASLVLPSKESVRSLNALEISVEPHSLKNLCRLEILKQLGRINYNRISELPLPSHLQEFVSHYREWGPPTQPVKSLCPIDHTKDSSDESKQERRRSRRDNSACGQGPAANAPSFTEALDQNGQRILVCNFNGVTFQVPIDTGSDNDSVDSDHGGEEEDRQEGHALLDMAQLDDERHNSEAESLEDPCEMSQSFEDDLVDANHELDSDTETGGACKKGDCT